MIAVNSAAKTSGGMKLAIHEPTRPPARMPGVMSRAMSQRIAPRAAWARTLATEVKRMVAIPVPTARCRMCARGSPCASNRITSSGTMIAPPPMPSIPAKKPTAAPMAAYPSHHSTGLVLRQVVVHRGLLGRAHVQAALGAPPQHVLGLARPLVPDEMVELALVEAAAEVAPEVALDAAVADDLLDQRPVTAQHAREPDLGQLRKAPAVVEQQAAEREAVQLAPGERLGVRPRGLPREPLGELGHRLLGEPAVGCEFYGEHR